MGFRWVEQCNRQAICSVVSWFPNKRNFASVLIRGFNVFLWRQSFKVNQPREPLLERTACVSTYEMGYNFSTFWPSQYGPCIGWRNGSWKESNILGSFWSVWRETVLIINSGQRYVKGWAISPDTYDKLSVYQANLISKPRHFSARLSTPRRASPWASDMEFTIFSLHFCILFVLS